ncbi:MAG: hypothetical protein ACK42L_02645 [Thermoanaerobaculum sp.]
MLEATIRLRRLRPVRELSAFLAKNTAFLTGGTVRDSLLGLPVSELDVAVMGEAEISARELAQRLGGTYFPLGHRPLVTYRVVAGPFQVDVWSVAGTLEEDILRRDFTVNAVFFQLPSGPLLDLAGGLEDLAAGKLEVIRRENLLADPLRVLRGLRLSLTRPLRLSQRSVQLLREAAGGLPQVARERIREEVGKILSQAPLAAAWERGLTLGVWHALGVVPEKAAGDPVPVLQRLEELRGKKGPWGEAAGQLLWAALAAPRLVAGEDPQKALPAALASVGICGRELSKLLRLVAVGEQLLTQPQQKAMLACVAPTRAVLAWYFARKLTATWPAVQWLWQWWVAFSRKPPLLASEEVVRLLKVPPGPERAQAITRLRQLQALGVLRSEAGARRYLQERYKPFLSR